MWKVFGKHLGAGSVKFLVNKMRKLSVRMIKFVFFRRRSSRLSRGSAEYLSHASISHVIEGFNKPEKVFFRILQGDVIVEFTSRFVRM